MDKQSTYYSMLAHYVDNIFLGIILSFENSGKKLDAPEFLEAVDGLQTDFVEGLVGVLKNPQAWADGRLARREFQDISVRARWDLWSRNLPLMRHIYEKSQCILQRYEVLPLPHYLIKPDPRLIVKN